MGNRRGRSRKRNSGHRQQQKRAKQPAQKQSNNPHWVSPYKAKGKSSSKAKSEELNRIATEMFGGRYYCIGANK